MSPSLERMSESELKKAKKTMYRKMIGLEKSAEEVNEVKLVAWSYGGLDEKTAKDVSKAVSNIETAKEELDERINKAEKLLQEKQ